MVSDAQKKRIFEVLSLVNYDKAILFGSRARGSFNVYSDFDLLVILSEHISLVEKIRLAALLRRCFASNFMDVDIIIKNKEDIKYLEDKPGSIVRNALREGITL